MREVLVSEITEYIALITINVPCNRYFAEKQRKLREQYHADSSSKALRFDLLSTQGCCQCYSAQSFETLLHSTRSLDSCTRAYFLQLTSWIDYETCRDAAAAAAAQHSDHKAGSSSEMVSAKSNTIFQGVSIFVDGFTTPTHQVGPHRSSYLPISSVQVSSFSNIQ